jgi:hypothetical protein
MPESTERIVSTEDLIVVGSGNRQIRVMKVEVGQRKALVMPQSHIGKAEVLVPLEEARALGKWLHSPLTPRSFHQLRLNTDRADSQSARMERPIIH